MRVISEEPGDGEGASKVNFDERFGFIHSDLTIGPNTAFAGPLEANEGLSCPGIKLHGSGFIVTKEKARELGLGTVPGLERHIREYRNGRDLTGHSRGVMVIDLFGLYAEEVRERFPMHFLDCDVRAQIRMITSASRIPARSAAPNAESSCAQVPGGTVPKC